MVVESVEERIFENPAFEKAYIWTFLEEVMDVPFDVLDVDLRGGTHGPGAIEC